MVSYYLNINGVGYSPQGRGKQVIFKEIFCRVIESFVSLLRMGAGGWVNFFTLLSLYFPFISHKSCKTSTKKKKKGKTVSLRVYA